MAIRPAQYPWLKLEHPVSRVLFARFPGLGFREYNQIPSLDYRGEEKRWPLRLQVNAMGEAIATIDPAEGEAAGVAKIKQALAELVARVSEERTEAA